MASVYIQNDDSVAAVFQIITNAGRGDVKKASWLRFGLAMSHLADGERSDDGSDGGSTRDRRAVFGWGLWVHERWNPGRAGQIGQA
jgi:hypothetical protein